MVVIILATFVVFCLLIDFLVQYIRKRNSLVSEVTPTSSRVFNETSVLIPRGLYFDKTHTWAFMEKNGLVKIGVDDFLLHATGSITRVEMKNPGETIRKGNPALSIIKNGKKLTVNAPVSGTIKSNNSFLKEDSSVVNSSPYDNGWIYMIEPLNWLRDTKFLIMAEKYKEWLRNELSRLKDFIAVSVLSKNEEYAPIILQDGGELIDNFLAEMSPEVWEDFQINFINTSK